MKKQPQNFQGIALFFFFALTLSFSEGATAASAEMTAKVRLSAGKTTPEVTLDNVTGSPPSNILTSLKKLVLACSEGSRKAGKDFVGDVSIRAEWIPLKAFEVVATPLTAYSSPAFVRCLSIKMKPK